MWREEEEAFSENSGSLVMGSFANGEWRRSDRNLSEESHVCDRQYRKEGRKEGTVWDLI